MRIELRSALARPETYPHGPQQVTVRETHISLVFLAGDRAYKLKKPVRLPFVDYGDRERRHEMCRAEVALNRRLAPDIYLGVRAVVSSGDGVRLAAEEDPRALDYVVEMRRYDMARTLAGRLRRGDLEVEEIAEVGRTLARFHEQAPEVPPAAAPVLRVERAIGENFHQLLALAEQRGEIEALLALERFAHAFIAAHAGLLRARAIGGRVRDGHGDLRAEHVLLDGRVRIVDCVEFDVRLRELDVADDLAFLVMDLLVQDGERFVEPFLRAYREAGGDFGGERLVSFYAAHRALVRAKVELVRAGQEERTSAARGRHSASARDLIGLAERFAWRARLPLVIAICGLPASGKSTLAQELAARSRLPHLSSDATRKRLVRVQPTQRAPQSAYGEELNRLTYAELGRRAAEAVDERGGAIVDATFRHRADRDAFMAGFAAAAPILFVECHTPASLLAERAALRERQPQGLSDASLEVVLRESSSWEPLDEVAPAAHVTLRSDRPVASVLADLSALLDRRVEAYGI